MRPVNHPTMPSGTVSCQTMDSDRCGCLLDEWREWASSAPPGNDEWRDRALENLRYCLENKTDQLDLSELNLTALPENWPASLRELDVSDNQLTALPEALPSLLQKLDATHNRLTFLPERLPVSLQKLYASDNGLTFLPTILPVSLETLYIGDNELTSLPEALPSSLRELYVSDNQLTVLPETLPTSLQRLYVGDNGLTALPEALPASLRWLDSKNNRLTALPEALPASLRWLDIRNNRLTALPETLPASLEWLDIRNNRLTALPEALPSSLQLLDVTHNRLTFLPEALPASLRELYVTHNGLTSLPEALPASLESLYVRNNQLTALPAALPTSLWNLNVSNNRLTALPAALPDSLRNLNVSNNRLTELPAALPDSLRNLNASDNRLTTLPEALPVSLRNLNVSDNRLTSLPISLTVFIDNLDATGNPLADLASGDPVDYFLQTIAFWSQGDNAPQWQKIQSEEGAAVFAEFLHKLHRGKNSLSEALYGRVREWLGYLAAEENSELRKQTFLVAEEAVTSCVDRAAFYFNRMYWLMMEDRAIKSGVDAAHLIETIRSGFRLQVLERIAGAHAQRRLREAAGFAEDIEIYLAYQYRLREALALPVYTELQFAALAGLTEQDIEVAQATVLRQEQTDFLRYLVTESTAWRQRLQSWDSEKTAAVEANYLEAIASADFSAAVDRELKENGLSADDSDAHRAVCKQLADKLLFAARLRLTEDYLINGV